MLEQSTSRRMLNHMGACELSPQEVRHVAGGTTGCQGTSHHNNGSIVDVLCDPSWRARISGHRTNVNTTEINE